MTVASVAGISINGANGNPVQVIGTCSMTLLVVSTLELDLAGVNICSGDFYQALLGCDLLTGVEPLILGPAMIHLPGTEHLGYMTWMQHKLGCIAHMLLLAPAGSAFPAAPGALPPPTGYGAVMLPV